MNDDLSSLLSGLQTRAGESSLMNWKLFRINQDGS